MNIVVLGLWHLGCVTAACCAEHFYNVAGLDFDEGIVRDLEAGHAPIAEPGLDDLLWAGYDSDRLSFVAGADLEILSRADVLWVCYDTPVDDSDVADVPFVLDRLERCLPALRPGAVVLISSQVPAGTCRVLAAKHPGRAFAYSPENLRLGKALEIFRQPDRVVVGAREEETRRVLGKLFAPFAADRIVWMSPESAEMTKHGINAFLALSVTFANEIARLCERIGADAREVEAGLKSESRIGPKAYLRPGGAFAGGTLARDVVALTQLAKDNGERADLVAAILTSNDAHKNWALGRLRTIFGDSLVGAEIAVLGLTYKPGTDTLRRSSAVELATALLQAGANVRAFDPAVRALPPELAGATLCTTLADAVRNADAAVIATEWPEIRNAAWPALIMRTMRRRVILDANRFLPLRAAPALGIEYFAVGSAI